MLKGLRRPDRFLATHKPWEAPMRRLILMLVFVIALAPALPGNVEAGFMGIYDVANWTTTLTGNPPGGAGSVDTSGAPNAVPFWEATTAA
jgi:hypothetical protein